MLDSVAAARQDRQPMDSIDLLARVGIAVLILLIGATVVGALALATGRQLARVKQAERDTLHDDAARFNRGE